MTPDATMETPASFAKPRVRSIDVKVAHVTYRRMCKCCVTNLLTKVAMIGETIDPGFLGQIILTG